MPRAGEPLLRVPFLRLFGLLRTRPCPVPPQIETVGLGWCKVGSGEGVKAVADMLMYNQSIRRLDLRGNGLGNDGGLRGARGGGLGGPRGRVLAGVRAGWRLCPCQVWRAADASPCFCLLCEPLPASAGRRPTPMGYVVLPGRRHLVQPRLQGAHQREPAGAGAGVQRGGAPAAAAPRPCSRPAPALP